MHLKGVANSAIAPLLGKVKFSFLKTRQPTQPSVGSDLPFLIASSYLCPVLSFMIFLRNSGFKQV